MSPTPEIPTPYILSSFRSVEDPSTTRHAKPADIMSHAEVRELVDVIMGYKVNGDKGHSQGQGEASESRSVAGDDYAMGTPMPVNARLGESAQRRKKIAALSQDTSPDLRVTKDNLDRLGESYSNCHLETLLQLTRSPSESACSDALITPEFDSDVQPASSYFRPQSRGTLPSTNYPKPPGGYLDKGKQREQLPRPSSVTSSSHSNAIGPRGQPFQLKPYVQGQLDWTSPFPLAGGTTPPGKNVGLGLGNIGPSRDAWYDPSIMESSPSGSNKLYSHFSDHTESVASDGKSTRSRLSSSSGTPRQTPRPALTKRVSYSRLHECVRPFGERRAEPSQPTREIKSPNQEAAECKAHFAFCLPTPGSTSAMIPVASSTSNDPEISPTMLLRDLRASIEGSNRPSSIPRVPLKYGILLRDPPRVTFQPAAMANSRISHKPGAYAEFGGSRPTGLLPPVSLREDKSTSVISDPGKPSLFQKLSAGWRNRSSKTPISSLGSGASLSTIDNQSVRTPRCSRDGEDDGPRSSPLPGDGKMTNYYSFTRKMEDGEFGEEAQREMLARKRRADPNQICYIPN